MGNFKRFMKNFWLSFLVYFAMYFVGALCLLLQNVTTRVPDVVHDPPRSAPWWVEIILWLHVLGSAALYFYLGTKLKSLGNHLVNFLSVSWSLLLGFFVIFLWISSDLYLILIFIFSFYRLLFFLVDVWAIDQYIIVLILSALPAIIIWLGMLYKTKKNDDCSSKSITKD